jgi:hypothetical protein
MRALSWRTAWRVKACCAHKSLRILTFWRLHQFSACGPFAVDVIKVAAFPAFGHIFQLACGFGGEEVCHDAFGAHLAFCRGYGKLAKIARQLFCAGAKFLQAQMAAPTIKIIMGRLTGLGAAAGGRGTAGQRLITLFLAPREAGPGRGGVVGFGRCAGHGVSFSA